MSRLMLIICPFKGEIMYSLLTYLLIYYIIKDTVQDCGFLWTIVLGASLLLLYVGFIAR
jgi:hypothetical protein